MHYVLFFIVYLYYNKHGNIMKIGTKIIVNGSIGEIIKTEANYGLIRFNKGQFVFNLSKIEEKNIVS